MEKGVALTIGIVAITGIILAYVTANTVIEENPYKDRKFLELGMDLPVIWLYIDMSEVNSREWADFMGRSSRAISLPFLNLCYQSIVKHNKDKYRVEVISGLSNLALRLGGWEHLPGPLRSALSPVGAAELAWIRACVLKKWGGIFLEPSTIALKGFGELPSDKVVFFGTDDGETYSGPKGTEAPGMRCMGTLKPEHPFFVKWEGLTRERIERQAGGKQFRGDEKWDARQLAGEMPNDIVYLPSSELSRNTNGKRIQLEDLLSAGQQGVLPFAIYEESVYVPIPWNELSRSRNFGWFLKMSEDQVMESDLVISHLFRTSLL